MGKITMLVLPSDSIFCYLYPVLSSYLVMLSLATWNLLAIGNIGKHDPSRGLLSAFTLEFVIWEHSLLGERHCAIKKLGLEYSTMRGSWREAKLPVECSHVRDSIPQRTEKLLK